MLGIVQFGTNYGAFNTTGQVPLDKVETMLSAAAAAGIDSRRACVGIGPKRQPR